MARNAFRLPRKFPLLPRPKNADKTRFGHTLVLAGSPGMTGAAILASRAALAAGSGLVTLGLPKSLEPRVAKSLLEAMQTGLPETQNGALSLKAFPAVQRFVEKRRVKSLAIGPGLSRGKETTALVRKITAEMTLPAVLDADGLNAFERKRGLLKRHRGPLILTPHEGEFERLFGEKAPASTASRAALAKKLSKFYDVVLVLKGAPTLVVQGEKVYVNRTGNPGLAKGGSGDVLTGVIAAFVAQGLEPFEAAAWGVYFHGLAADLAVKEKSQLALLAGDVIDFLPKAFLKV